MPTGGKHDTTLHLGETFRRLLKRPRYREGVIAQAFYVGAQIMCWTFIIHYGMTLLGMDAATAQRYNTVAMVIFCSSRFVCTYLLRFVSAGGLLACLAAGGAALTIGTIFLQGMPGIYSLIGVSACMSLMFPTIYGIALKGLGEEAKIGSAGLVMAIVGGALMPPLQGRIIDMGSFDLGFVTLESVRASFVLPLVCFVVIAAYGYRTFRIHDAEPA
jgi:FHS family L-fucose permease-like MFS transporter